MTTDDDDESILTARGYPCVVQRETYRLINTLIRSGKYDWHPSDDAMLAEVRQLMQQDCPHYDLAIIDAALQEWQRTNDSMVVE